MVKRILICTGGTGGHIFPALALAKQLKKELLESSYIYFAGGNLSKNRFFNESYPYKDISSGPFPIKNPLTCLASLGKVLKGICEAVSLVNELRPDIVIGFGSYHTFPLLLVCRLKRIPYILHAADSIPGRVIRLLSKKAIVTGIVFPEAKKFLKGKTVEVGLPLREGIRERTLSREDALLHYGLKEGKKTLLVFGGSQGASFLNEILGKAIEKMQGTSQLQVIHLVGLNGDTTSLREAYLKRGIEASVKPFEERMDYAWSAADLVVSRAGAGTIAEQIAFEVPGILIPYRYASENHQKKNADFMCKEVGGAFMLREEDLTSEKMAISVEYLLQNKEEVLKKMKSAIQRFKEKDSSEDMCSLIKKLMPIKKGEG